MGVGDPLGMHAAHAVISGMGGLRTAGDLVARMQLNRGMRIEAAKQYVAQKLGVGVDAEWPLLLQRAPGIKVGYRACEGLEFETPDRYRPEIESAGGLAAWTEAMNASPKRWAHRLRMAAEIAETAARLAGGKG